MTPLSCTKSLQLPPSFSFPPVFCDRLFGGLNWTRTPATDGNRREVDTGEIGGPVCRRTVDMLGVVSESIHGF